MYAMELRVLRHHLEQRLSNGGIARTLYYWIDSVSWMIISHYVVTV